MTTVLVADRGEIAVRIIRACAEYGARSVAVYADSDVEALHVRMADEAFALPGGYLDLDGVLDVAARSGADAVHPGSGFLAESVEAARRVEAAGLTWIGPTAETLVALGDKTRARELARQLGAPPVPGSDGPVASAEEVLEFARTHGLPVMIKPSRGGGGRGLRVVRRMADARDLYHSAVREATASFGSGTCFVEAYVDRPRHVEVQVLGDGTGSVATLGTRDCSVQRRGQQLLEEAPAPFLTPEQTAAMTTAARRLCSAMRYRSAGTVEFLVDRRGTVSFLGVDARLQVEHAVTEEVTAVDLIRQQLLVADGRPLEVAGDVPLGGHAIELRLAAEDPGRGFVPAPGTVVRFDPPGGPGVRVDSGVVSGSAVPAAFDSLLATVTARAPDRPAALARARAALAGTEIAGVPTVVSFHRRLLADPALTSEGETLGVHTRWVEDECAWLTDLGEKRPEPPDEPLLRTWIEIEGRRTSLGLPAVLLGRWEPDPPTEEDTSPAPGPSAGSGSASAG